MIFPLLMSAISLACCGLSLWEHNVSAAGPWFLASVAYASLLVREMM